MFVLQLVSGSVLLIISFGLFGPPQAETLNPLALWQKSASKEADFFLTYMNPRKCDLYLDIRPPTYVTVYLTDGDPSSEIFAPFGAEPPVEDPKADEISGPTSPLRAMMKISVCLAAVVASLVAFLFVFDRCSESVVRFLKSLRFWTFYGRRSLFEWPCVPSVLYTHSGSIECLASHGDLVASSNATSRTVLVWDLHCAQLVTTLEFEANISCLELFQRLVCVGLADGGVALWDLYARSRRFQVQVSRPLDGVPISVPRTRAYPTSLVFDPDGRFIYVAVERAVFKLDAEDGRCVSHDDGHLGTVTCLVADGTYIVSGSTDRTLRVFRATHDKANKTPSTGQEDLMQVTQQLKGLSSAVSCLCLNGSVAYAGSRDGLILGWPLTEASESPRVFRGHVGVVLSLAAMPATLSNQESKTLASVSIDGSVRLWDGMSEGNCLATFWYRQAEIAVPIPEHALIAVVQENGVTLLSATEGPRALRLIALDPLPEPGVSFARYCATRDCLVFSRGSAVVVIRFLAGHEKKKNM